MPKSKKPDIQDIVVVGGGLSGRIAALKLAQLGFSVSLVAPVSGHSDGRTTALWQKSISLLEDIGVWDELVEDSARLKKMRMIDDTDRLFRAPEVVFDSSELGLEEFGFNILNSKLNKKLQEKCDAEAGLTCVTDSAGSVTYSDDFVEVCPGSDKPVRARLAVAADGRQSLLRQAADIEVKSWSYPQVAVVLNVEHRLPHADISTEFHTQTGPFTLVPLPGRMCSIVCVETEEGANHLLSMPPAELARELERRAHSIVGTFEIVSDVQHFPLSGLNARSLIGQRLALIGETAHVFPPIGAQGLNLSLRDIDDLASTLQSARIRGSDIGGVAVLQSYEDRRRSDIASRTNAVDALNRSLLTSFLPAQIVRSAGMYMAGRIGPLRRLLMREGMAPRLGLRLP
ncbi:UbiH/UbiF family hydroxylase [Roseibium sp. HPY-6]|uniref:UbiH/UbiF family hydroxylase n=1 Tax=Roseibium sp. HPY-6 TaxID=3229852 RepID=UPI00338DA5AA